MNRPPMIPKMRVPFRWRLKCWMRRLFGLKEEKLRFHPRFFTGTLPQYPQRGIAILYKRRIGESENDER